MLFVWHQEFYRDLKECSIFHRVLHVVQLRTTFHVTGELIKSFSSFSCNGGEVLQTAAEVYWKLIYHFCCSLSVFRKIQADPKAPSLPTFSHITRQVKI